MVQWSNFDPKQIEKIIVPNLIPKKAPIAVSDQFNTLRSNTYVFCNANPKMMSFLGNWHWGNPEPKLPREG